MARGSDWYMDETRRIELYETVKAVLSSAKGQRLRLDALTCEVIKRLPGIEPDDIIEVVDRFLKREREVDCERTYFLTGIPPVYMK